MMKSLSLAFLALASVLPAGCSLFRSNPLDQRRGAVVLVFDTRTAGDLDRLRETLSRYDARATFFAGGQITRRTAWMLMDLREEGHAIGLSGLRGVDPQTYSSMYGRQKYFQDEIVTQVLEAERESLDLRYFLLRYPTKMKSAALELPPFLVSKGFASVVDLMPDHVPPAPMAAVGSPVIHAYQMRTNDFDRAQIASLAKRNEILVVAPDRQVLPELLEEACAQSVPFATLSDLD